MCCKRTSSSNTVVGASCVTLLSTSGIRCVIYFIFLVVVAVGGPEATAQSVIRAIPVFNEEPVC